MQSALFALTLFMTILSSFLIGIACAYYAVMGCLYLMRANDRRNTPKPEQVLVTTAS